MEKNLDQLSEIEKKAMRVAVSRVNNSSWRKFLSDQIDELIVKSRTRSDFGYYVNFEHDNLRINKQLNDELNKNPPEARAINSSNGEALFFIIYMKNGHIDFLEASSTGSWPSQDAKIIFDCL
jgi:hypothetical protein